VRVSPPLLGPGNEARVDFKLCAKDFFQKLEPLQEWKLGYNSK